MKPIVLRVRGQPYYAVLLPVRVYDQPRWWYWLSGSITATIGMN